jgi:NADH-quinone oxidoreductase subunit N
MNIGAFAVVSHLAGSGERYTSIDDYAGLGRRSPLLAFTLTIFMLSLIGIPLTGGFFAKYYVFSAALNSNLIWLSIIGLVNSAVAAYYYLRLIVVMYMREQTVETEPIRVTPAMALALVLAAIATIYLGVAPNNVVEYATQGAKNLLPSPVQHAGILTNKVSSGSPANQAAKTPSPTQTR